MHILFEPVFVLVLHDGSLKGTALYCGCSFIDLVVIWGHLVVICCNSTFTSQSFCSSVVVVFLTLNEKKKISNQRYSVRCIFNFSIESEM